MICRDKLGLVDGSNEWRWYILRDGGKAAERFNNIGYLYGADVVGELDTIYMLYIVLGSE